MPLLALLLSATLLGACPEGKQEQPGPEPAVRSSPAPAAAPPQRPDPTPKAPPKTTTAPRSPPGAETEERCLDAWLAAHGLNTYGDPPDRMYMGGTPLFDERTGVRTERRDYVYRSHPEARSACAARR